MEYDEMMTYEVIELLHQVLGILVNVEYEIEEVASVDVQEQIDDAKLIVGRLIDSFSGEM